jgi:hypothetical protein
VKLALPAQESSIGELEQVMVRELCAAGLYEKEAIAMVNTWRTNWFHESGTRLLYLLAAKQTEDVLPLTVQPSPDEVVRVLVGRLETLTPEDCRRIRELHATLDPRESADIKAEVASLNRFAEPAFQFLIQQTSDAQILARLKATLAEVRAGRYAASVDGIAAFD